MAKVFMSAVSYVVIVFPLALVWHLVLFEQHYIAFGYFEGTPNIALGFATIVIQGIALAMTYPLFKTKSVGFVRALQFSGLMGVFFWTSHVLALVAKQSVPNAGSFLAMETGYLVLQFGLFALALGILYRTVD